MGGQLRGITPLAGQGLGQPVTVALGEHQVAWCNSRSTVAVASVSGMSWSNPEGWMLR